LKEIINFSTKFESLEQVNPLITKYRINICQADKPAKKYVFSKSVIEGMSSTIRGAGVYAYYFENEKQLGGHEDDIVKTPRGYKRTGEPIAYGFSDPYKDPYWMEIDGEPWFTSEVYLWTGRNPHIEEVLKNPVYHSMEVAVDNEPDINGNKKVTDAIFLGFCLLQGIQPAFEGSKIQKLSLPVSSEEVDLLKQEYEKFSNQSKEGDKVIKEAVEKFSLTSSQIHEILSNALSEFKYGENEWRKYWVNCYDDEFVYVEDSEDCKTYRMKYIISEMVATVNMESKEEVIRGNFVPVSKPNEMHSEEMTKEDCEDKSTMEDMSSNEYVDNTALEQLNKNEAENNKEISSNIHMEDNHHEEEMDKDQMMGEMKEKMHQMENEMKMMHEKMMDMESKMMSCSEENTQLKEFKASIDKQNKEFEIETTLKDVINVLPKDELENCRLSAETYTLENISVWKNEVQAKAFKFSKGITEKKPFMQIGLPIVNNPKKGSRLWD
jgi:hypothetical protein